MISYDHIFIDLDGPILDGKKRHYECYKDIVSELNGTVIPQEEYWNLKRQKQNHYILYELSQLKDKTDIFMSRWVTLIEDKEYLQYDELKPNIKVALTEIGSFGNKVILVTMRKNKDNLFWQLEKLGLCHFFDKILICDGIDINSKAEQIADSFGGGNLFIGDTEIDIYTADVLDMDFVGINNGLRSKSIFLDRYSVNELFEYVKENKQNEK